MVKDIRMYETEQDSEQAKLVKLQSDETATASKIKRQTDMVDECKNVLTSCRNSLQNLLKQVDDMKASDVEVSAVDETLTAAREVLGIATPIKVAGKKKVAVFGASRPDEATYELSVQAGKVLAGKGYLQLNGGYGGTMEGASKGAASVTDAEIEGVVVSSLFIKPPNQYLTSTVDTTGLGPRIEHMVTNADIFVVLPGTIGTLTELAFAWNMVSLEVKLHNKQPRKLFVFRKPWEAVVSVAGSSLGLLEGDMDLITYVDSVEELASLL